MAYICCTKKIIDLLDIRPSTYTLDEDTGLLGPWYANLFFINRKKCLIFMNSKTLFSFVVVNLTKKDIKQIGNIFRNELLKRLQAESIEDEMIRRIMDSYEEITLCKTFDKRTLGSMNEFVFHFNFYYQIEEGSVCLDVDTFNTEVAGTIMKLNGKYIQPRKVLRELLDKT